MNQTIFNEVTMTAFNDELVKYAGNPATFFKSLWGGARKMFQGHIEQMSAAAKKETPKILSEAKNVTETAATGKVLSPETSAVATPKKKSEVGKKLWNATKFGLGGLGLGAATIGGGLLYGAAKMEPDIARSNITEPQVPTAYGGRYY